MFDSEIPKAVDSGAWKVVVFGNGAVGWQWETRPNKMPRIADFWGQCAVHIYRSVEDAKNPKLDDFKIPRGATGCVFGKHTRLQPHLYIVTNRHVVRSGGVVPKLFLANGQEQVIDRVEDDWLCNEVEDDLAILPLVENLGVHALVEGHFPSEEDQARLDLGVGDDVVMWGRFSGQADKPVARFGNIAAWPARQVPHPYTGAMQESFLVEMRSHCGYSGSPVFLYINPGTARPWINSDDPKIGPQHYAKTEKFELFFIGIDWGHIGETAMAAVVPWYRVGDLLNCEKLVQMREERDRRDKPFFGTED